MGRRRIRRRAGRRILVKASPPLPRDAKDSRCPSPGSLLALFLLVMWISGLMRETLSGGVGMGTPAIYSPFCARPFLSSSRRSSCRRPTAACRRAARRNHGASPSVSVCQSARQAPSLSISLSLSLNRMMLLCPADGNSLE